MKNRLIPAFVALLGLLVAGWLLWPERQPMPTVVFNLTDSSAVHSKELIGEPLLINFWSVSCAVCLRDMPKLTRLAETLADRGLRVIGVAMPHDPPPVLIDAVKKLKPGFPVALDVHGEINRAFGGIDATPTTFLIGRDGTIVYREQGPIDETRIRATFLTL
jgi:thiol-disulfide isomerase/thioredoxin